MQKDQSVRKLTKFQILYCKFVVQKSHNILALLTHYLSSSGWPWTTYKISRRKGLRPWQGPQKFLPTSSLWSETQTTRRQQKLVSSSFSLFYLARTVYITDTRVPVTKGARARRAARVHPLLREIQELKTSYSGLSSPLNEAYRSTSIV